MTGGALVLQGDARRLPLPDASADLICTSPPYLWKRKYAIEGDGELGNEQDWRQYLDNLYTVTDEMLRVLKPSGSIWVNLGDTRVAGREPKWLGIPPKSRLLLPERYRVGCQDRYAAQGVIVRQVQIWQKVNGLPESTRDRTRDSHEDWVQIVKRPNYYSATDEIRESHVRGWVPGRNGGREGWDRGDHLNAGLADAAPHPLGKLPGSVWAVPSEPLRLPAWLGVEHYAAFPSELVRRIVLAFSPPGICLECGQGRVPVVERAYQPHWKGGSRGRTPGANHGKPQEDADQFRPLETVTATILGYACSCTPFTDHPGTGEPSGPDKRYGDHLANGDGYSNVGAGFGGRGGLGDRPRVGPWREYHLDGWKPPPTCPAVVLDSFSGVGTTIGVARQLGRIGIGVDLSHPYCRAARWRVFDAGSFGKAQARTWADRQGSLI